MAKKRKTVSGGAWTAAKGEKQVGLTLTPEEHFQMGRLAAGLGLRGKSALARALSRWALRLSEGGESPDPVKKILGNSLDSRESGD